MKTLLLSTALATATALGATAYAGGFQQAQQAQTQRTDVRTDVRTADGNAFLSSNFTGMTVYARDTTRSSGDRAGISGGEADRSDRAAATSPANRTGADDMDRRTGNAAGRDGQSAAAHLAERENWDDIGSINDVVITRDGEIEGVIVDVGGFLGLGARSVKIDMDDLEFVRSEDGAAMGDDFYVVVSMSRDELEALPEWDEDQLRTGAAGVRGGQDRASGPAAARTDIEGQRDRDASMTGQENRTTTGVRQENRLESDGTVFGGNYATLDRQERTADRLIGAEVFDATSEEIGNVEDLVLRNEEVQGLIVDIGGFLGLGAHTVSLPVERADIRWIPADEDVRVQVPMTREQLEAMPAHDG
jgi:sporulation protein YlmC with PRC-barrel domain